jgi:hypothetical protein
LCMLRDAIDDAQSRPIIRQPARAGREEPDWRFG